MKQLQLAIDHLINTGAELRQYWEDGAAFKSREHGHFFVRYNTHKQKWVAYKETLSIDNCSSIEDLFEFAI